MGRKVRQWEAQVGNLSKAAVRTLLAEKGWRVNFHVRSYLRYIDIYAIFIYTGLLLLLLSYFIYRSTGSKSATSPLRHLYLRLLYKPSSARSSSFVLSVRRSPPPRVLRLRRPVSLLFDRRVERGIGTRRRRGLWSGRRPLLRSLQDRQLHSR